MSTTCFSLLFRKSFEFIDTLCHHRGSACLLHEFVVMPDHIHVLLTPQTSPEKAVQFIKGGFSYRAKKELGSSMEVWQKGFSDPRVGDAEDDSLDVDYIRQPIHDDLCDRAEEYPYSSAGASIEGDPIPHGLKPILVDQAYGAPEGAPLSKQTSEGGRKSARTSRIREDRIL